MCCKGEAVDDVSVDFEQCGKRTHVFWQDPLVEITDYLRQSRSFADNVYVISHNSREYDAQFLLGRFLELRWVPKLKMNGSKILNMVVDKFQFLYSLIYLPMSLKSMPKSLDIT